MRVIMDLVINHTSDQHEWFKKSCARVEPYTDFYIWRKGKGKDGKKVPNNWMSTFPGSAWEYNEQRGEFYLHLYAKEQPDLNHDNPKVREAVKDVMRYWLDMGVDGFREDVITQISKVEGLPNGNWLMPASRGMEHYNNGPHIHEYLQEYRKVIEQYDAFQVGEAPLMNTKTALTYVNENKKELDMMISFQHMNADCIIIEWVHTPFSLPKLKRRSTIGKRNFTTERGTQTILKITTTRVLFRDTAARNIAWRAARLFAWHTLSFRARTLCIRDKKSA